MLYADDLVVIAETEEDLIKRLNEWKDFVLNRGMRVNMNGGGVGDGSMRCTGVVVVLWVACAEW